jgi:alkanesulfonate monooxygenase SsuD/methylene tetrahydromethanopterin reductase-like flavin-dependent oxidoreductase (luciferase family)
VELGLGPGAVWEEVAAWGGPVRSGPEAEDALAEAIEIIRRVWAGERAIEVSGEHYRLRGADGGPTPVHPIGIWLGAYGRRMMTIIGRRADGWIPSLPRLTLTKALRRQELIDEAARAAGRDPTEIRRVAHVTGVITDGRRHGWLQGPVEHWVEELARLVRDCRFDGFVLSPDPEDPLGQTRRFAAEVAPAFRAGPGADAVARVS